MPIRRLNYTNRHRIKQDDVSIIVHEETSPATFDMRLSLDDYGFPADARVFVEAYRQTTLLRFDFGTVGVPRQPANTSLAAFESPAAVRFRVRVSSVSGSQGLLLGLADKIRPHSPGDKPEKRQPLLPPRPDDLGEELWRVDFDDDGTFLVINNKLPDWKAMATDPQFRALVFPAAMRRVLDRILHREKYITTDDPNDWRSLWLMFAARLPGSGPVPAQEAEYDDWIEDAVAAFARGKQLRTGYQTAEGE